jgi:hypothetical protein
LAASGGDGGVWVDIGIWAEAEKNLRSEIMTHSAAGAEIEERPQADEIEMTNFWVTFQRLTSTILGKWEPLTRVWYVDHVRRENNDSAMLRPLIAFYHRYWRFCLFSTETVGEPKTLRAKS